MKINIITIQFLLPIAMRLARLGTRIPTSTGLISNQNPDSTPNAVLPLPTFPCTVTYVTTFEVTSFLGDVGGMSVGDLFHAELRPDRRRQRNHPQSHA